MDRVTGLAVRRGQPNGPSGWVRLGDREQDLGRPVAEGGPAVLDVGWMADRFAGPEPSRQEPSFSSVTSISPVDHLDSHLAVLSQPPRSSSGA
jgi:hypothetical protein